MKYGCCCTMHDCHNIKSLAFGVSEIHSIKQHRQPRREAGIAPLLSSHYYPCSHVLLLLLHDPRWMPSCWLRAVGPAYTQNTVAAAKATAAECCTAAVVLLWCWVLRLWRRCCFGKSEDVVASYARASCAASTGFHS